MNRLEPSKKPIRFRLKALRADLLGNQRRLVAAHNGFVRYQVLRRVFTVLANADANQRLFIGNLANYGRSLQHSNLALVIGDGLICSEGEAWRRQRRLTQPAFDRALLVRVVEITSGLMDEVLAKWDLARERGEPVEVFSDMQNLAMRVISIALFSHDPETASNSFAETVRVGLEVMVRRNISPVTVPLWVPIRLHRRFRRCLSEVDQFVYERIEERLANNDGYTDILNSLIRSYGDQASHMKRELRDQVVTLFFAGFETTGTALAWTWLLLSQNEECESRFHEELAMTLNGRTPTYEDLSSLAYTGQLIQESMRLYPPVYSLTRNAVADDQVGENRIHQGDNVVIPIHALHRMEEYWDSPDTFCPERFAPGKLTEAQRRAYVPFSTGQRKCMGTNFATIEMLTVLAVAGQHVRLRLVDGHPVVVAAAVTQYPRHGLQMRVEHVADQHGQ
jgi:cytochrome P450